MQIYFLRHLLQVLFLAFCFPGCIYAQVIDIGQDPDLATFEITARKMLQVKQVYLNYNKDNGYGQVCAIYKAPFNLVELDSMDTYTIGELLELTRAKYPALLDSTIAYVKKRINNQFGEMRDHYNRVCNTVYDKKNPYYRKAWVCKVKDDFVNLYDSVVNAKFDFKVDSSGVKLIEGPYKVSGTPFANIGLLKKAFRKEAYMRLILFINASRMNRFVDNPKIHFTPGLGQNIRSNDPVDKIKEKYFGLTDIDGLISSPLLQMDSTPAMLNQWIIMALSYSKAGFPEKYQSKIGNVNIEYDSRNGKKLWMDNDGSTIYISAALVRAVFLSLMTKSDENYAFQFNSLPQYNAFVKTEQAMLRQIYKRMYLTVKYKFISSFVFILSHELSHICLEHFGYNFKPTFEFDADSLAFTNIRTLEFRSQESFANVKVKSSLGLFEDLLVRSFNQGKSHYWGYHSEGDIAMQMERLKVLKAYQKDTLNPQ
jgi:hypothetical protein